MTEHDRTGTYDPFEDTGDWPFRESATPPAPPQAGTDEQAPAAPAVFDREAHEPAAEPEAPPEPVAAAVAAEPEPETEPEPEATPEPEAEVAAEPEPEPEATPEPQPEPEAEAAPEQEPEPEPEPEQQEPLAPVVSAVAAAEEHAPGELQIPEGPEVLSGSPNGFRRTVAVVVSRFNADITNRLLESVIGALVDGHVSKEAITIVPVPGAFELPLAAMALAKTRRFSCVVAVGCVIRGETPHFDFVAGEAASGLQLAAIETGVPVSFGLLTCETREQAEARVGKGADAARAALEMADLFTQVRTRATRTG